LQEDGRADPAPVLELLAEEGQEVLVELYRRLAREPRGQLTRNPRVDGGGVRLAGRGPLGARMMDPFDAVEGYGDLGQVLHDRAHDGAAS
jgi:hypothetical protein